MPVSAASVSVKRLILGRPIPTHLEHQERLSRVTGLAVLSSDALSSVAYATEEILRVLAIGGAAALAWSLPIAGAIATLLAIVAFSYRQTIHAYPGGGGAYIVSRENLGTQPALIAAAALLIDYTLTVAVSIAAGVAAITSAFPALHASTVALSLGLLVLLTLGNLRGIRESGRLFAVPTYFFIVMMALLLLVGLWRALTEHPVAATASAVPSAQAASLGLFALLTAFSNGCTAMTGVEAVSNGVPAFRAPESKNAAQTLTAMAVLAIVMFAGITVLAHIYGILPSDETIVSQIARTVFGGRGAAYYAVQFGTMSILVLAANTAYADFPRLASIVARDGYLPRQFANRGDRLAFSNGIVVLSACAAILLVGFRGDTHALLPLYMIGVFISFTLSQTGMVVRWRRMRSAGWVRSAIVNGVGAAATAIVLVIVAITKSAEGAWIILALVPVLVLLFTATRRHYAGVARELSLETWTPASPPRGTVLVPVGGVHRAVLEALGYANTLSGDVRGVFVNTGAAAADRVRLDWARWAGGTPLVILPSPYRSLLEPLVSYIADLQEVQPNAYVTIILPEFVPARWWQHLLHNQQALLLKAALHFRPGVVVTSVPFHLRQ